MVQLGPWSSTHHHIYNLSNRKQEKRKKFSPSFFRKFSPSIFYLFSLTEFRQRAIPAAKKAVMVHKIMCPAKNWKTVTKKKK